ncbi:MAG TPA: TonB-dependent receptor [Burkholderiaceae bacterium]
MNRYAVSSTRPTNSLSLCIRPIALAAMLACAGAGAQEVAAPAGAASAPATLDTVIVTSRKRPETLTQTPAAISVFNTQALEERNIDSLSDIGKYTPNMDVNRFGVGNPSHAAIFIRGIGIQDHIITTDPSVGVYLDGVYLGRQMGANLGLSNIERVEVLRGPQGTLYGKNTLGGAVNIITVQPGDEQTTKLALKLGTRGRVETSGYGNYKLSDQLSILATGDATRRDGVGKALLVDAPKDVGEEFQYSGRVAAKLKVTSDFSLTASVDGVRGINGKSPTTIQIYDTNGFFPKNLGLNASQLPANPDDSNSGQADLFRQTNKGLGSSLVADWKIDDHLTAKLLVGYRYSSYTGGLDDDNTYADLESFPERGYARQTSFEPQLSGQYGNVDFITGLYYGEERGNTNSGPWTYIGPGGFFDINQVTKSKAVYGHLGYKLRNDLRLSGGLRYSHDAKDADAQFDNWADPSRVYRSNAWSAVTGDVSISYDIRQALSTYATVSTGYQNGGFPPRPFGGPGFFVSFDQTKAINFESGLKGSFFDNLLQGNLAVFYTRYKDLPLQVSAPDANGFNTFSNSAEVVSKGVEVDGRIKLTKSFSVQAAVGYNHSRVTNVEEATSAISVGNTPALTPTWTVAIAPKYSYAMDSGGVVDARVDYSFRGSVYGQSNNAPVTRMSSRALVGFNVTYIPPAASWTVSLYGENIFNKVYDVGRLNDDFAGFADVIRSNDRSEFGVKLSYAF